MTLLELTKIIQNDLNLSDPVICCRNEEGEVYEVIIVEAEDNIVILTGLAYEQAY